MLAATAAAAASKLLPAGSSQITCIRRTRNLTKSLLSLISRASHTTSDPPPVAIMLPVRTQWQRLIRFVAAETSQVHIGQPVDTSLDVGLAAFTREKFKAYEIIGSALDPAAQLTTNTLTVKELLAPLSREDIKVVRCLGLNYADHAEEAKMRLPAAPILFYKPVTSLIGPLSTINIPLAAQPVERHLPDYEVEFAIVIGKPAKNVSESDALDYVLGYTASNDVSFRLHQTTTSQWSFSKSFDNTNPLGPCLVSAKSIPDPQHVPLTCSVNGQVLQDGTTADQIFSISRTISFLSQGTTLEPGSIILTGTPKGVGFVKKPAIYLKHGDRVDTWIGQGIGTLVNWVKEEGRNDENPRI